MKPITIKNVYAVTMTLEWLLNLYYTSQNIKPLQNKFMTRPTTLQRS